MSAWTRVEFLAAGFTAMLAVGCGANARSPARHDLYHCEGCEAALERDAASLTSSTTIAGPDEPGERLILRGVVSQLDGAPAPNVVIYAYHTNTAGHYANGTSETRWSRLHGRLRGWARTGADGVYEFHTIKPAPYPDRSGPAHIHLTVGELGRTPYYIDNVVFDGEFGVTEAYRQAAELRGGDGVARLDREGGALLTVRHIRLEAHPP